MSELTPHAVAALVFTIAVFVLYTVRRVPVVVTSLLVLVALPLAFVVFPYRSGERVVDPRDFYLGFGHEALVAICALLVLGQGLVETGALNPVTRQLAALWKRLGARAGMLVVLVVCLLASGVVNDTPIVVLLIPVLAALARQTGGSASRQLMPMNFAVLVGGMATTIGTSTNLLVVAIAARMGAAQFGVFDFTPLVAIAALVALPYLWLVAPRLLPAGDDGGTVPAERRFDAVLHVPEGSPLDGATLEELLERSKRELRVKSLHRGEGLSLARLPNVKLAAGDRLVVSDTAARLKAFERELGLRLYNVDDSEHPVDDEHPLRGDDAALAEVILLPTSNLVGWTIREQRFADRHDVVVLGAFRSTGSAMQRQRDVGDIRLAAGDVLLVQGAPDKVAALRADRGLVVVDGAVDAGGGGRGGVAAAIMLAVVALAATKVLPMYLAALAGVLAMFATRCLKPEAIGRALKADVIMLVAASLALGKALLDTGAASALAHAFSDLVAGWPPLAVLGAMMLFVAVITNFVSNNAAAAIGTPIAVEAARSLGAPAEAYVLAILFGCNLCYATPIGYQTNLLVMSAARYRFADFIRVGAPLLLLMWGALTALLGWRYALW
ncbi:MAG: SLC13 family permease [Burkholderiaceae bacterium]|nr:SLC13 family permease [Burkholderiaceae bacterium]